MATVVLIVLAAALALVAVASARRTQKAPALLYIERTPRRIRRRNS